MRAALINSGLVVEAPSVEIRLEPPVRGGSTSDLDLPIALLALTRVRAPGVRCIFATGRLGLDGAVHARGLAERTNLAEVVEVACRTRGVRYEHMFEEPAGGTDQMRSGR